MKKQKLLVLDDNEGVLSKAPSMRKLRDLAEVTILDHRLSPDDEDMPAVPDMIICTS